MSGTFFVPNVTLVPDLNFGNLDRYQIAVGEQFEYKEYSREYFKERNLKLDGITYHDRIVALLERAQVLFLYRVNGLKNVLLNREGEGFLELEHFVIEDCDDLEQLFGTPHRYTRNQGLNQSFSKLTTLEVSNCSFKFLFTSSCAKELQQLKKLDIRNCGILEEIIGTEGEKDEQDHFDDRVHFSKLKELRLWNLQKLRTFGPKTKEKATVEGDSLPKGQSLFTEKVIFPALEELYISMLPNVTKIWDKQVITGLEESEDANNCSIIFPLLRILRLANLKNLNAICGNSTGFFYPQVIFPALEELNIWMLPNITKIWDKQVTTGLEESGDVNNCSIIFPQLRTMYLMDLENLNAFCGNSTRLFDPQVHFPALESIILENLPNIEIFKQQLLSKEEVQFPALQYLTIGHEVYDFLE